MENEQRASAPIERIPLDVLPIILEYGTDDEDPLKRVLFVLRVASVSREWRAVAESTPALWTTIYITIPRYPSLATIWSTLERSRSRKLDIFIDWAHNPPRFVRRTSTPNPRSTDPQYIYTVMTAVSRHIQRWRSVDLSWDITTCDQLEDSFAPLFLGSATALETLRIYCFDHLPLSDSRSELDFFRNTFLAPQLHRAEFIAMPRGFSVESLADCFPAIETLTWNQSSSRVRSWWDSQSFLLSLKLLRRLKCLTIASLHVEEVNPVVPTNSDSQTLFPALERLGLTDMSYSVMGDLLAVITAPLLAHLTISNPTELEDDDFLGLWDQSSRLPSLHTVRIEAGQQFAELPDLKETFQMFGSLHCIQIAFFPRQTDAFNDMLEQLSSKQEDSCGWCFPKLASMTVYCPTEIAPSVLRDLVQARITVGVDDPDSGVEPLQHLRIRTSVEINQSDLDWFKQHLEEFSWAPGGPLWDVDTGSMRHTVPHYAIEFINRET